MNKLQLETCDIYLMIPGRLNKDTVIHNVHPDPASEQFIKTINDTIQIEYNGDFIKNTRRHFLGNVTLFLEDEKTHQPFSQVSKAFLVVHPETKICILELIVTDVTIGGNKLLNAFCGNTLKYAFTDDPADLNALMELINITPYGGKRSIVFSDSNAEESEIINALANEEYPMGNITGAFAENVKENHAQYDTAEVYVSPTTMFEKCRDWDPNPQKRSEYQAVEVFFVELLLYQDAAVDEIYHTILNEEELQRTRRNLSNSKERFSKLSFDMSQAIKFADYNQFLYPTVKLSAETVAKSFGIDYIYEKYNTNKSLLQEMITANDQKISKEQEQIKNRFLLIIAAFSAFSVINEALNSISGLPAKDTYLISIAAAGVAFGIYELISWLKRRKYE